MATSGRPTYRDQLLANKKALDMLADMSGKPRIEFTDVMGRELIKAAPIKRTLRKPSATPQEPSEHEIQKSVIAWWLQQYRFYKLPRFALAAIPNAQILMGSARNPNAVMGYLHTEGFRDGAPDLFLFAPSALYHGLAIEMKTRRGIVSPEQKEWIEYLNASGYQAAICRSADHAITTIKSYLQS